MILYPLETSVLRLKGAVLFTKEPVADQTLVRWQVSLSNSFPAARSDLVYDTQLRAPDDVEMGADWVEIYMELLGVAQEKRPRGAQSGVTYYVSYQSYAAAVLGAWAPAVAFTMESAECTAAIARQGA